MGGYAQLVQDVATGTLDFASDGSFTYSPSLAFDGTDHFVYELVLGGLAVPATVTLTACGGGPDVFVCWKEPAFLELAAGLGYFPSHEGFEDDATWGGARTPYSAPFIESQGVTWTSNHPDAPVLNPISTTSGPPHSGQWAVFDPDHGYAEGTPGVCDVDVPPEFCLFHDGFTGSVPQEGPALVGVGGYMSGIYGAKVDIIIDDTTQYAGVRVWDHQFLGLIDTRPEGFRKFSFEEQDGKVGQAFYIWGDDFTFLRTEANTSPVRPAGTLFSFRGAGPNPASRQTHWSFSLPMAGEVRLDIHDARGRRVRTLVAGGLEAGWHEIPWNGRDDGARQVAAGIYFARLRVEMDGHLGEQVRKVTILR